MNPRAHKGGGGVGQPVEAFPLFQPDLEKGPHRGFGPGGGGPEAGQLLAQHLLADFLMAELITLELLGGPHEEGGGHQGLHRGQGGNQLGRVEMVGPEPLVRQAPGLFLRPDGSFVLIEIVADGLEGLGDGRELSSEGVEIGFEQGLLAGEAPEIGHLFLPGLVEDMQIKGPGQELFKPGGKFGIAVLRRAPGEFLLAPGVGLLRLLGRKGREVEPGLRLGPGGIEVGEHLEHRLVGEGGEAMDIVPFGPGDEGLQGPGAAGADDPEPGVAGGVMDKPVQAVSQVPESGLFR